MFGVSQINAMAPMVLALRNYPENPRDEVEVGAAIIDGVTNAVRNGGLICTTCKTGSRSEKDRVCEKLTYKVNSQPGWMFHCMQIDPTGHNLVLRTYQYGSTDQLVLNITKGIIASEVILASVCGSMCCDKLYSVPGSYLASVQIHDDPIIISDNGVEIRVQNVTVVADGEVKSTIPEESYDRDEVIDYPYPCGTPFLPYACSRNIPVGKTRCKLMTTVEDPSVEDTLIPTISDGNAILNTLDSLYQEGKLKRIYTLNGLRNIMQIVFVTNTEYTDDREDKTDPLVNVVFEIEQHRAQIPSAGIDNQYKLNIDYSEPDVYGTTTSGYRIIVEIYDADDRMLEFICG